MAQFSDTSTYKGLIQLYEKETGFNRGDISSDTNKLKEVTADINVTLDEFTEIAIKASGMWQWDDSNQTDYPIIKTALTSGQRDYPFTTDGSGNIILEIYKVAILPSSTATLYEEISPIDPQSDYNAIDLIAENTNGGSPYQYDKTANSIFLDPIPNYTVASGLKVYINREASYFISSDTTKKAGIPGIFHEYLALKPALKYAGRKKLANYNDLLRRVIAYEGDESRRIQGKIIEYFGRRERDVRNTLTPESIDYL